MGSQEDGSDNPPKDQTWGTWDELLLACAVKRHGFHAWDSVSMEVQSRSSLPLPLTTADNCRLRYLHLKRRFSPDSDDAPPDKVVHIPWLEELRKLRVAELQQEVQRYDVSILSLQLKVKKLEEEREESLREKRPKPDLAEDSKGDRSVQDKRDADAGPESSAADRPAAKSAAAAGEESDRENRSVNESNSTGVKSERDKTGDEVEEEEEEEEEGGGRKREGKANRSRGNRVGEDGSGIGGDETGGGRLVQRELGAEPGEEGEEDGGGGGGGGGGRGRPESGAQSKENSSDVQSSASLTQKKNRRKRKGRRLVEISGGGAAGDGRGVPAVDLAGKKKSQPLMDVLKMIRAHKDASVFERRLPLQESEKYRGIVRQHMDLEAIESRVERGYYSSSLPFYRDLLLLFSNALVFYPKSSVESLAALDLQRLVSSHFRKAPGPASATAPASHSLSHSQRSSSTPDAPERSDSLLAKHKSSAPIIVCRKRSSMSAQQPSSTNNDKKPALDSKPAHEQGLIKMNAATKERSVTGTRSLRRSGSKIITNSSPPPNPSKKQTPTSTSLEKAENSNSKAEGLVTASIKKRSAADFLKRIKRNSPAGGKSKNSGSESSNNNNNNTSNNKKASGKNNKSKKSERGGEEEKEEGSPSKPRTVGRPPKKGGTPEYSNVKRGREVGGKESASASASASTSTLKRPRKRGRR
ncbi:LOW QUALITY PROTEIN: AF4/FMR2 family member lilli [Eucalyptus grandis]|uniref:LOW QUALITY PROTEIN: AF4/FMR2 family member lilli n=1 Tax=Eucalyptus grandis TaxID=71139 RepID=UPI00192F02D2|nr:LOW QUALITY PROTEIN: AF4/FMR2 family member lilli [Eucalyptus grandis]